MTTKTAQPSAADLRAAQAVMSYTALQPLKLITGGTFVQNELAEIISHEMEPERREMLEALEAAYAFVSSSYYNGKKLSLREALDITKTAIAHAKGKP